MYKLGALSTLTLLREQHRSLSAELFHLPSYYPSTPRPLPGPLVASTLLPVCTNLTALGPSRKWNHTLFALLCLAHFTLRPSRSTRVVARVRTSFLFKAEG